MPNNLGLAGATAQKQVRFSALFTSRFFSGLWTNRSPLRDATTSRIVEKFYGQAGDALIAGSNVEISTKLTMVRRPGNSLFDSNTYTSPKRFYEFKLFNASTEQILIMIDQANTLYSWFGGVKTTVFSKSTGAGQSFMQSVGNTMYFGDGLDNKKYLQTLFTWTASTAVGNDKYPFFNTFWIDAAGNIQQLVGTHFPISEITISAPTATQSPIVTVTSTLPLTNLINLGDTLTFPDSMALPAFRGQQATVLSISGYSVIVSYPINWLLPGLPITDFEFINGSIFNGGNPTTGLTIPVNDTVSGFDSNVNTINGGPSVLVNTQIGNYYIDNGAIWFNHQAPVENWGIDNTNNAPVIPILNGYNPLGYSGQTLAFWSAGALIGAADAIVDQNNNIQFSTAGGTTGLVRPNFSQILGQSTYGDGSVTWICVWISALSPVNGGYKYCVGLVNTLDQTVSNVSSLSLPTGNFIGSTGYFIQSGAGLPVATVVKSEVDTQTDYVAIFRTTDGQSSPFLIPGNGTTWTISLKEYMENGYLDTAQDSQLNNLISAPINLENTPPAIGAINLVLHLGSIWYSIGNVVYWTSGALTPVGNGVNGTNPLNFDELPSLVKRLVPVAAGMVVFTVSDVFLIAGSNTASSPIQPALPILPGVGLLSYNALDLNGALIGLFTTDNQFLILDPSAGTSYAGLPIGDQLLLNNGNPGQSWNPSTVYVAWHVQGMDQGWYLSDGVNGWYKLIATPSPEGPGYTWAPFATIVGGVNAVQSVEITPGVHRLLAGPTGTGPILERNLNIWTDNGTPYPANATVGSAVLAQPGQIAEVAFITTDSIRIGTPLYLGLLINEALPYYKGPIDYVKDWEIDPPGFPESQSFYGQRFYLANMNDEIPAMRHMQIEIVFSPYDTVQNELNTLTIYGSFSQEL